MTPWKFIFMLFVFLLPGGSLVLLAVATAKALRHGRRRVPECVPVPAVQPVVVVVGGGRPG